MRDAVIVEAVRTPVGKRDSALSRMHPVDLSAHMLPTVVEQAGVDVDEIDDVMWGCVSRSGEQSFDVGRNAALAADFPDDVTGVTVDRQCDSSQQAVHVATAGVIAGHYAVAGGVKSVCRVPMFSAAHWKDTDVPTPMKRYGGVTLSQGIGAEVIAEQWGPSRAELDELSLSSHGKAVRPAVFDAQIATVILSDGTLVSEGEGIRVGGTLESLASLKPVFRDDGVIHAGNASQISDADDRPLNPSDGAITIGHPLGGSGARITTMVIHQMRDNGIRYGLQSMREGGGQVNATIIELI